MRLRVQQALKLDVYSDMARIPAAHRLDDRGQPIPEGRVCRVVVGCRTKWLSLRGKEANQEAAIYMDEVIRNALKLDLSKDYDFQIKQAGWIRQFWWAWGASDPTYRITARIGVVSVLLGLLGLFLGIISLYLSFRISN